MAKLVVRVGRNAGSEFTIDGTQMVMGRKSANPIPVLDPKASRHHAEVGLRDGQVILKDMGSRNGTLLNGQPLSGEKPMNFGDKIAIGDTVLELVDEKAEPIAIDIPGYKILEKIGSGGMGVVYKARQLSMDRIVALKVLNERYSNDPEFIDRFIREARAAGKLNHPNVIHVHDVSKAGGRHYFSMEYIDGSSVKAMLRRERHLTVEKAIDVVLQTAKALEFAHEYGIIHRDIKPDNIMVTKDGIVKIADLGIAKSFEEGIQAGPAHKRIMGTPHYMAPEQALGKDIDHRVDIYSLGATFYHMITGDTPFSGATAHEVLKAHIQEQLPPIQELNKDVPDPICFIIERMMAKSPEKRYPNTTKLIEDLERSQEGIAEGIERIAEGDSQIMRAVRPEDLERRRSERQKREQQEEESTTGRASPIRTAGLVLGGMLAVAGVAVIVLLVVRKFMPQETDSPPEDPANPNVSGADVQEKERTETIARAKRLLGADPASADAEQILNEFTRRFPNAKEIDSVNEMLKGVKDERNKAREADAKKAFDAARDLAARDPARRDEAIKALEAVVRQFPDTKGSKSASAEILRLQKDAQDQKDRQVMADYDTRKGDVAREIANGDLIRAKELLADFQKNHAGFALNAEIEAKIKEIEGTLQRQYDDAAAQAKKAETERKNFAGAISEWDKFIRATKDEAKKALAQTELDNVKKRGQTALDAVLKDSGEKSRKFKYDDALSGMRAAEGQFSGTPWMDQIRKVEEGIRQQISLHEKVVEVICESKGALKELGFHVKKKGFEDADWLIREANKDSLSLEAKGKPQIGMKFGWTEMEPIDQYRIYRMYLTEPTQDQHKAMAAFCFARDMKTEAEDHLKKAGVAPAPENK